MRLASAAAHDLHMSQGDETIFEAIDRWERSLLIDGDTARRLRADVTAYEAVSTGRLSQYLLAITGAVVLVIAGGVFLDWAWPLLDVRGRTGVLTVAGVAVIVAGVALEGTHRWRPASYLLQTSGAVLVLASYVYSAGAWGDGTLGGRVVGFLALATPIVLAPRALRRNLVMPAVHLALGLGFLAVFLNRATSLSDQAIVWVLDAVLLVAILGLVSLMRRDPAGERHPWALNAFVMGMGAGFVLVSMTVFGVLSMSDGGLLALDLWLALSVALTLWGVHRAPPGLHRGWFDRLLAYECLAWVPLGLGTAFETFDGPPELGVVMVGGVGVLAFIHADRHGLKQLMGTASLAFIVPVWWWAVERAGALGGVAALLATAGFLFWASGRRGSGEAAAP